MSAPASDATIDHGVPATGSELSLKDDEPVSSAGMAHGTALNSTSQRATTHHRNKPSIAALEQLAAYEGHDADIPSNEGVVTLADVEKGRDIADGEKTYHTGSGADVEASAGRSSSTSDTAVEAPDPNIVGWDSEDDPQNPMNWSAGKRWGHCGIISAITFVTPLASSMFAPGVPALMKEFHSDNLELASFVVSVYLLGFAAGPLLLAPLSELHGRLWIYHSCNVLFLVFTIGCAVSTNLNMLIGFRFLAGCVGAAPLTIGGGSIADLVPQQSRGVAMSLYGLGPLMGPVIGPIAGGFLAQSKGWRWVFWLIAIVSGVVTVVSLIFMRETYAVVILARKAAALRKSTGNPLLRSKFDTGLGPRALFLRSIIRPMRLLIFSPIVQFLSLYLAVVYGYLYLLFTTFPVVFEKQYGFSSGTVGLTYLGIGLGSFVGLGVCGYASDKIVKKKSAQGEMKPEYRLPVLVYGAATVPIGLFWYGWSAQEKAQFIAPIIGTSLVGIGLIATYIPIQTYLVDAFTIYAASALAANTVLRSVVGAVLPLAGQKMYQTLGLGWGNSLLAFIAMAMTPIPWFFMRYGEKLRKRSTLKL